MATDPDKISSPINPAAGLNRPVDVPMPERRDSRPFSSPPTNNENLTQESTADDIPPVPPSQAKKDRIKKAQAALKNPRLRVSLYGMDYKGKFKYNDIENLPPIEIDEEGYAIRPKAVSPRGRRNFSIADRKVRFLLMWNYSAGNKTLACQEAGITRKIADEWLADPAFKRHIDAAQEEIADRLHFRLAQRIGLIPIAEHIKVNDTALLKVYNKYRPGLFADQPEPAEAPKPIPDSAIPRPPK